VVFKGFEAGEGGAARNQLMAEARFVLLKVVILVNLLVAVLIPVWTIVSSCLDNERVETLEIVNAIPKKPILI
jgi:hypothetical protein